MRALGMLEERSDLHVHRLKVNLVLEVHVLGRDDAFLRPILDQDHRNAGRLVEVRPRLRARSLHGVAAGVGRTVMREAVAVDRTLRKMLILFAQSFVAKIIALLW